MRRNLFFVILMLVVGIIGIEILSNKMNKNNPDIDQKIVDSLFKNTTFKSSIGELKSYIVDYQYLNNSDSILVFELQIQGQKRDTLLKGRAHKIKGNWQTNNW